jgi:hypothetical protein
MLLLLTIDGRRKKKEVEEAASVGPTRQGTVREK